MVKDDNQGTQAATVQGDKGMTSGENRKGDVQEATSTGMVMRSPASGPSPLHREQATISDRSQQRSNVAESAGGVPGSAGQQASAVRGLVNLYEVAVLYDPGLEIDLEKASSKIEKIITEAGGKITNVDNWGKRKLAYPIAKNEFAVYVFYSVEMEPKAVGEVEHELNIADEVIRFLITRPDLKAKAKAEALAKEKAAKAAERGEKTEKETDDNSDKDNE